jgi:hypothetical protein
LASALSLPEARVAPARIDEWTGRPARVADASLKTDLARSVLATRLMALDEGMELLAAEAAAQE